ncbi:MAG: hypothetical protein QG646_4665, partial [Euryarchaeota archaeon]|nr:hypothetical protein [Euryarchaeota archaeon]
CGSYEHLLSFAMEKIAIEMTEIENLLKYTSNTPIIIKIAVEGHELSVLDNFEKLLKIRTT